MFNGSFPALIHITTYNNSNERCVCPRAEVCASYEIARIFLLGKVFKPGNLSLPKLVPANLWHCVVFIPRPHPLTRKDSLVNQVKFLGLTCAFMTSVKTFKILCNTSPPKRCDTQVEMQNLLLHVWEVTNSHTISLVLTSLVPSPPPFPFTINNTKRKVKTGEEARRKFSMLHFNNLY